MSCGEPDSQSVGISVAVQTFRPVLGASDAGARVPDPRALRAAPFERCQMSFNDRCCGPMRPPPAGNFGRAMSRFSDSGFGSQLTIFSHTIFLIISNEDGRHRRDLTKALGGPFVWNFRYVASFIQEAP